MKLPRFVFFLLFLLELTLLSSGAQEGSPKPPMGGMNMPSDQMSPHQQMGGMAEMMEQMHPKNFIQEIRHHATSGTSAEPNSVPAPMLMSMKGNWMLMFHGNAFVVDTQRSSPRGGDNNGDGTFSDRTAQAHLSDSRTSTRSVPSRCRAPSTRAQCRAGPG